MRSLQRRETTSSIVERRKQVSKRALTSWIQNSPFHCEHVTYRQNLRCFLTPIRWPRQATRSKTKKLTFSLEATKFCLVLRSTPAVPTQNCFQAANQHSFARKNPFAFPPKDCTLLHVDLLSRYDVITGFRTNSEVMRFWNFSKSVWSGKPT